MKKTISLVSAMALSLSSIGGIQAFAADTSESGTVTVTVIDSETNKLFRKDMDFSIVGGHLSDSGAGMGGAIYLGGFNTSECNPYINSDASKNFGYKVQHIGRDYNGYGYRIDMDKSEDSFDFTESNNQNVVIYMEKYWFAEPVEYTFDEILNMDEESFKNYCNINELEYIAPDVITNDLEANVQFSVMIDPESYLRDNVDDVIVSEKLSDISKTNTNDYIFNGILNDLGLNEEYYNVNVNEYGFEVISETDFVTDIENPTSYFRKLANVAVDVKDKYADSEEYIRLNQIMRSVPETCENFHSFSIEYASVDTPKFPDWVPDSYEEAEEFYNTYGSTRVQDGLICIAIPKADNREYNISTKTGTASELSRRSFTSFYSASNMCDIEIAVYEPSKDCNLEIEVTEAFNGKEYSRKNYTFEIDENGNITQTDIFSFVPDCNTEFKDFIKKYGTASVHGEYIVYAPQIGYDFMSDYIMNQDGTADLEEVAAIDVLRGLKEFMGDNTDTIFLYTPVSDGVVDVNWIVSEEYKGGDETGIYTLSDVKRKYDIDEKGNITDITAELITGDLNGDSKFTIADAVVLEGWLLGKSSVALPDWKAADFCNDDNIDIFDFIEMKKAVTEQYITVETAFVPMEMTDIRYGADSHNEWKGYIVRNEDELAQVINENEETPGEIGIYDFSQNSYVVIYSKAGAGNKYSVIDDFEISGDSLNISTITKQPEVATPDMLYRRYIYAIDSNSAAEISNITFNDSYSTYSDSGETSKWFKDWCESFTNQITGDKLPGINGEWINDEWTAYEEYVNGEWVAADDGSYSWKWYITNEEIISLSLEKAEEITWTDFEDYCGEDVGSGLYIMKYPIAEREGMYLLVGGGSMEEKPYYVRLFCEETEEVVDIRSEEFRTAMEDFLAAWNGPENDETNRAAAKKIGEYALAELKSGRYTIDTEIDNASEIANEEIAALFDEDIFSYMYFVDEHTVHISLNKGLLDAYGYLVTDGTVSYAEGDYVEIPDSGYDGEQVYIDWAGDNLYYFSAGT